MDRQNNNFEENNNHSESRSRSLSVSTLLKGNGLEDNNRSAAQEFLKLICSEELYKYSLDMIGVDTSKINLETHLSHQNIQMAGNALKNIKRILQSNTDDGIELLLHNYNFYKCIPHQKQNTLMRSHYSSASQIDLPEIICSTDQLEAKMRFFQAFVSISFAMSIIRAVKTQVSAEDKLCQSVIQEIGCTLNPVERLCMEHDLLFRYFEASNHDRKHRVIEIFHTDNDYAIQGPKGSIDFEADKMWILLWRACPLYRVLATMRHGLDDTVWNDTTETSQAFRLYDMAFPCIEAQDYNKCALLLYEVFLGIPLESHLIQKSLSTQYDSLVVRGTVGPDPGGATVIPGRSTVIPTGSIISFQEKDSIFMKHPIPTKYFVYKREQVRLKYLVLVETTK